ncbi:MAG: VIT1/CCC1 transporter family protein [Candidatus Kerfeldbacteria bacterium]|nr:VIT1/CCC1 transporter family protein [Candidatus Kerfeldbacteria bacterium]
MEIQEIPRRKDFIHHQQSRFLDSVREIVFGAEDGMVSTLGALTGIAIGTQNHFTVVLSGFVIVAVESISMGVGSYLSAKSVQEVNNRKLDEERIELDEYPEEERRELIEMYVRDGWPEKLALEMANTAAKDKSLLLKEMAYRELAITPEEGNPLKNGLFMLVSYIVGGAIPVLPYLLLSSMRQGVTVSVIATLIGLFCLGVATTKFTKRSWWKSGLEITALASVAAIVGYAIGSLSNRTLGLS